MRKESYCIFMMFFCLAVFSMGLQAQTTASYERDWDSSRRKITVMSYNIMNGFQNGSDTDRIRRMAAWLKLQSPDILALEELCGYDENKLKSFAASYGHAYTAIVKLDGYPVGLTSRTPIEVVAKRVEGYGHGLLHCQVSGLDILVTHLNPNSWEKRREEAARIVAYIREHRLEKCLLMGDMNAHSPFDAEELEKKVALMKNKTDYSVISTFLAASLHDVCRPYIKASQRYSFPTAILPTSPKGESKSMFHERLDYIFVTDRLLPSVVDAAIYNGPDTDYLSDHYPVSISLFIYKGK